MTTTTKPKTKTKSQKGALPTPPPPDLDGLHTATNVTAFIPLLLLGAWFAIGPVLNRTVDGLVSWSVPDVPRVAVVAVVALTLASLTVKMVAAGIARARHERAVENVGLFNALAKAGGFDATMATFKARREGGSIVGATVRHPILDDEAARLMGRALAGFTGNDPDDVQATASHGKARITLAQPAPEPDVPQVDQSAPEDPEEVLIAPDDPLANEHAVARAERVLRGGLNDTKGKQFKVRAIDSHKDGAPSKLVIHYPPERSHGLGEQLAEIVETLTATVPPKLGVWRHEHRPAQDCVVLTDEADPLAGLVPLEEATADVDLLKGVPIGRTDDGRVLHLPLLGGAQIAAFGATGSGKSSFLWDVFHGIAPAIADGRVKVSAFDPKMVELYRLRKQVHQFASDAEEINELLGELIEEMYERKQAMAEQEIEKIEKATREFPLHLIVVDEVATMSEHPERAIAQDFLKKLAIIVREGRALGYTVIVAGQDVRKSALPIRGLFTVNLCFRVNEAADVAMVLGQGARAQGAFADKILRTMPGVGYMTNEATGGIQRFRLSYIPKAEQDALRDRLGKARLTAPDFTPGPGGPVVQDPLALDEAPTPERPARSEPVPIEQLASGPGDPPETGTWVKVSDLPGLIDRGGHVHVMFEGDFDTVRVTAAGPGDDDQWEVTYAYPDGPDTVAGAGEDEEVQVMPAATWR